MSDNDGVRQPRADGTILDLLPIGRVVLVAGLFIVALFVAVQPAGTDPEPAKTVQLFLNSLPGIVGNDVIAVSSDLHYLNVWTVAGRTAVLGRLGDVATEQADSGMQVHRSHWVAHQHVTRVVGTSTSAAVVLSNQLRIPVSRRRWKSVREQYGRGVVLTAT